MASWAYFDTSALVKRYISESGSVQVRDLVRRHDFLSSAIIDAELLSAFCRRKRVGDLSEGHFTTLLRRMLADRSRWELVEVNSAVLGQAGQLIQGTTPINTLDAIHLASLMTFQVATSFQIPLVTADARQRDAAEQVGLRVIWIG
jgi:uncharacterized protein